MTQLRRPSERHDVLRDPAFDAAAVVDQVLARDRNDRGGRRRPPSPMRNGQIVRTGGGVHAEHVEIVRDGLVEGGGTIGLHLEITPTPGIRPDDYVAIVDRVMGITSEDHPRRNPR